MSHRPIPQPNTLPLIRHQTFKAALPLRITLHAPLSRAFTSTPPYLTTLPRVSYLPFLLPRLHAFFLPDLIAGDDDNGDWGPHTGWFEFEGAPLKWHLPVGLLFDMLAGSGSGSASGAGERGGDSPDDSAEDPTPEAHTPWHLTLHFGLANWPHTSLIPLDPLFASLQDSFINHVKEADMVRFGHARGIMSLSKADSTALWTSVMENDLSAFEGIMGKLLNPPGGGGGGKGGWRGLPVKIYLPSATSSASATSPGVERDPETNPTSAADQTPNPKGTLRVLQSPIAPYISSPRRTSSTGSPSLSSPSQSQNQHQTLGTALKTLLPSLFPSARSEVLAKVVLHGAVVPLSARLEDVVRFAGFADGWVHLGVRMMG